MPGSRSILGVDHRFVRIHKADNAHQRQAGIRAVTVGHGNDHILIHQPFCQFLELTDALLVGPAAQPNGHGALINPKDVAALHLSRRLNISQGGYALTFQELFRSQIFLAAQLLPHGEVMAPFSVILTGSWV